MPPVEVRRLAMPEVMYFRYRLFEDKWGFFAELCKRTEDLAAESHVDRSINEPARFVRTNVLGVFALMEVARRRRLPVVHVSTDEVYGDMYGLPPAGEEAPLRPSSPYSASKASGDLFILSYVRPYGVEAKIVRPSNMYGPYQHPEKLIPRTVVRILLGGRRLYTATGATCGTSFMWRISARRLT